jgi:hypothetical protein
MAGTCPIVKPPENIDDIAANLQKSETVNAVIRRFPQIGFLIRAINPAADMTNEPIARHVIAHQVLREERQAATMAALSLVAKSKPLKEVFNLDDLGFTVLRRLDGQTEKVHINDLLEGKLYKQFNLTAEQRDALLLRKNIWGDLRRYYNKAVGRSRLRSRDDMFPRKTLGWFDGKRLHKGDEFELSPAELILGKAKGRKAGALATGGSFTRSRAMNPDGSIRSAKEMVEEGWRYVDPDAALHSKALEISRRTADAQFQRWLISTGIVKRKAAILGPGARTGVSPERWGMQGFDASLTPALKGYYAPPDVVKYINELLAVKSKPAIGAVTWLVQESRAAIASMDFGTTGVQLLGALGADTGHLLMAGATLGRKSRPSAIFPIAVWNGFKSWFSPTNLSRYYAANKEVIERWAPYLGGLRNTEYVSALLREPEQSFVMRIPGMKRFARAFEASLDVAKIEYVKSLERILGTDIPAAEKEALGAWVRNVTGVTSTARLGVSPRQQDIEATWLFFSPRFTRSLFATVATIFKTDKAGNEARLALGGLAAAATALYLTTSYALGQKPDLEPLKNGRFNPDFFSVRIGNNRIGIGGGMRALARLFAESYESAKTDPTRFISPDFSGAHSNPFLSFWRSRAAPLSGTVLDIWSGETFTGTALEDGNDWVSLVRERTLPFAVQAALEARGGTGNKVASLMAAGFGLNTTPLTAYQIYDEYLKSITYPNGEQRFPDGANTVHTRQNGFKEFIQYDPIAKALKEQYERERLTRGGKSKAIQVVLDERAARLEAAEEEFKKTRDYYRYRNQVNQIRAQARTQLELLHLGTVQSKGDRKLVQSWYETYDDPRAIDPITGGINPDGLELVQEEWKRAHPGEYERLIEPAETIGETPMETELRRDRKYIADSGWWDADEIAWNTLKDIIRSRAGVSRIKLDRYKDYYDYRLKRYYEYVDQYTKTGKRFPELLAEVALQRDPIVKAFQKLRARERLLMQYKDPELTRLLSKWGYNQTSLQEYRLAVTSTSR